MIVIRGLLENEPKQIPPLSLHSRSSLLSPITDHPVIQTGTLLRVKGGATDNQAGTTGGNWDFHGPARMYGHTALTLYCTSLSTYLTFPPDCALSEAGPHLTHF